MIARNADDAPPTAAPTTPFARVLLTGGTGFLGSAVARALLARGHGVRVLARAGTSRRALGGLDVEYADGDLLDAASLARAARGADALVHCAADYRIWVPEGPARMEAVNLGGTRDAIRAAAGAGARRIVHVSSVATLKPRADGTPADEGDAATAEGSIGPYKRTKVLAERAAEALAAEGAPVVIANPSTPIGPRDLRPTPTGRIVLDAARGRVPGTVDTGLNVVHADDCAAGIVAALERGRLGERYVLGGQDVPLRDLVMRAAAHGGRTRAPLRLPAAALWPVALASETFARLGATRGDPLLTLDGLRMARRKMYFSSAKAARELGHSARPWGEAVDDAVAWFRSAGMLAA